MYKTKKGVLAPVNIYKEGDWLQCWTKIYFFAMRRHI